MKIGVTGAGGQLGASTIRDLLTRVKPADVVAVTRDPSKLEALAKTGVAVRAGDFAEPDTLAAAFVGVERLLIVPTSDLQPGLRALRHRAAIEAAKKAGVKHLVYVSIVGARPETADIVASHFETERALIESGIPWTVVRMGLYAENFFMSAAQVVSSGIYATTSSVPVAYVVRDDLARLLGAVLATDGHEYMTYHATGSVAVTPAEIAETVAHLAGKPVQAVEITDEQFAQGAAAAGLPPVLIDALIGLGTATRQGSYDLVSGDIELVTGQRPESMLDFLARNRGLLTKAA